jgi:hypothetical protein
MKLKTSSRAEFNKSGLCVTIDEAYANALTAFVAMNDFARITSDDQAFNEQAQSEFNSKMTDQLRPQFGKEYCGRYEISKRMQKEKYRKSKPLTSFRTYSSHSPLLSTLCFPKVPRMCGSRLYRSR